MVGELLVVLVVAKKEPVKATKVEVMFKNEML